MQTAETVELTWRAPLGHEDECVTRRSRILNDLSEVEEFKKLFSKAHSRDIRYFVEPVENDKRYYCAPFGFTFTGQNLDQTMEDYANCNSWEKNDNNN